MGFSTGHWLQDDQVHFSLVWRLPPLLSPRPSPRLMLLFCTLVLMAPTLTPMVLMPMVPTPTPMVPTPTPMEPTTLASVMLRPSPRLMLLFCTLVLMAPTLTPMVPTPMATGPMLMELTPTPMEPTTLASVRPRPSP